MPSDDREQQFERGLARHLRGGSGDAACPDAEILAAYHERTLAPEELELWKNHIAGCERCQETLALVESSEVALEEQKEKEAVVHLQPVSEWLTSETASAPQVLQAAEIRGASVVEIKGVEAAKSEVGKKFKMLRWAAPVGAIAAVLLLWVGLRHSGSPVQQAPAQNSVQMAENRESRQKLAQNELEAADEGRAARQAKKNPVVPTGDHYAAEKDAAAKPTPPMIMPPRVNGPTGTAGVYARSDHAFAEGKLDRRDQSEDAQRKLQAPMTRLEKNEGVGYGSGSGAAAGAATAAPASVPPPVAAGDAAGANATSGKVDAYASSVGAGNVAAAKVNENKAKEEMPPSSAQTHQAGVATAPVATSSTSQTVTAEKTRDFALNANSNSQLMKLAPGVADGNVITAPTGKQRWRLGLGGLIEHSSDGGKIWKAQKSGVSADLISGMAPSEEICWVVGKAGTLLLTTDEGKHWKLVNPPVVEDFNRVQASDGKHAKIWNTGNHQVYVTHNAGVSWTLVPQQD